VGDPGVGTCHDHRMTRRALVLGGGGLTGIGWMWGVLAGLAEAGLDLRDADLVVGTSAGSVVGPSVAHGLDAEERYQAQLAPSEGEIGAALGPATMLRLVPALLGRPSPQRFRARVGRIALRTPTVPEAARLAVIAERLPVHAWPERALLRIAAVDAVTGEFRAFDRESGVPLVQAVAASCAVPAVWPPVTADGRRWIDGGVRSPVNADLADGYERVVVLAPLLRGFGAGSGADAQVARLRAQARVALVSPDPAALAAIGRNVLDPAQRAPAARAGRVQAASVVDAVRAVWSG
jgi:NTE family protein